MDVFAPIFKRLMQRIDYSETGGAPLLGIEGVSIIGHGRSHAKAIANGIRAARDAAASGYVAATREALQAREGESA
jgi:glycerol-3-phosphate acyltransferase PlsX